MKILLALLPLLLTGCMTHRPHIDAIGRQETLGTSINYAGRRGVGPEAGIISDKEVFLGVRKNVDFGNRFQGFMSGGAAAIVTEETSVITKAHGHKSTTTITDNVELAPYLQFGVNYFVSKHYTFGVLYRHDFAEDSDNAVFLSIGYSF
jgi:hypothetical protein